MADIGTLNPEQLLQQQQILRQQKMAEMLMQQGMQQPQGQIISGRYVAPSIFQNLAGLANQYVGQKGIEKAEQAQIDLAKAIRQGDIAATADFMATKQGRPEIVGTPDIPTETYETVKGIQGRAGIAPNPQAAFANLAVDPRASARLQNIGLNKMFAEPEAFTLSEGAKRFMTMPDGTVKEVAAGSQKPRAPLQIDTGTAIELRDPNNPTVVLQRIPKSQMPTAGQIYESADGPLLVDTRTNTATPLMIDGQKIPPKLSSEQSKDITAINQQRATINGAIADVKANPTAFSFGRGLAQNAPYGESIAGRFEKPENTQARAYVFNNVSAVIKERAGTAQTAGELTRLNAFLPATTDNADQIIAKLEGFNQYLNDQEKGTRVPTSKKPDAPKLNSFASEADAQKAFSAGTLKVGDKITINGVTGTWK
jgi:hypothetical protein